MYVCICKGITEEQLKSVATGSHSHQEVLKQLGIGDSCGVCVIDALKKLNESKPSQTNADTSIKK